MDYGPAHTIGRTAFKHIEEVKAANFLVFNRFGTYKEEYWRLKSKEYSESLKETCSRIKYLLEDSISEQLKTKKTICTMLSGGLDSSIMTAYASNYARLNNLPNIKTFSVDYIDNDKNFMKSDFQPNSDNYYIDIMVRKFNTSHKTIVIDTPELADKLKAAMVARGYPGMADVDSSLLLFCENIKKEAEVAISGECADEIFAGYPWFFEDELLKSKTFPWSLATLERKELLRPEIRKKINIEEYIIYRYEESLKKVEILECDSKETAEKRQISYLTINWFMQTLLDRADKMANSSGLEIRVPFCDYRIVECLWNVPWEIKALNGREKGLLRYITKELLPGEIVDRKKSPYPKTHNPTYLKAVKEKLYKIIKEDRSPLNNLVNKEYVLEIIKTEGKKFQKPWFGQLMTGPQLMAYLIQVNMWLEEYKPRIEI